MDIKLVRSIWGGDEIEWIAKNSIGQSGGLLLLWKSGICMVESHFQGYGFIGFSARFGNSGNIYIVNVYSPYSME